MSQTNNRSFNLNLPIIESFCPYLIRTLFRVTYILFEYYGVILLSNKYLRFLFLMSDTNCLYAVPDWVARLCPIKYLQNLFCWHNNDHTFNLQAHALQKQIMTTYIIFVSIKSLRLYTHHPFSHAYKLETTKVIFWYF